MGLLLQYIEKDKSDEAQYVKYKDLGDAQYNYDKKYYETYYYTLNNKNGECLSSNSSTCDYDFALLLNIIKINIYMIDGVFVLFFLFLLIY